MKAMTKDNFAYSATDHSMMHDPNFGTPITKHFEPLPHILRMHDEERRFEKRLDEIVKNKDKRLVVAYHNCFKKPKISIFLVFEEELPKKKEIERHGVIFSVDEYAEAKLDIIVRALRCNGFI